MLTLLATLSAFGQDAPDPDDTVAPTEDAKPWDRVGWGFGGVPAVNFNSDEGAGFGVVASIYRYDGQTAPYKSGTNLVLFATTKAIHAHSLEVDMVEVGHTPLRLTVRGALDSTKVDNYCGVGNAVTCDPAIPAQLADDAGLTGQEREDFERRYYRTRYIYPNLRIDARYAFDPMPHRFEVIAGYRASMIIPGDFGEKGPWPGSLYAQDFGDGADGGERGLVSVVQVGAMLDNRDNEPSPIRGYWIEGVRSGGTPLPGKVDWQYLGFNTTLRGYVPLGTERAGPRRSRSGGRTGRRGANPRARHSGREASATRGTVPSTRAAAFGNASSWARRWP